MKHTIYKYPMTAKSPQKVEMPVGAKILCVEKQDEMIFLWAIVERDAPMTERTFLIYGTGHATINPEEMDYIGTVHGVEGWMVFHVFETPTK